MAIDWDTELLAPVMAEFGEGSSADPSSWPIYYPAVGTRMPLPGAVFDAQYQRAVDLAADTTDSTARPVLGVRDSLFGVPPAKGEGVFIPSVGKTFRVLATEPDGHGHTLLILGETAIGQRG